MSEQTSGSVMVELNATAAQLLASLCVELETEDVSSLVGRALGLFEMSIRTKRQGGRLLFENERGEHADVVF